MDLKHPYIELQLHRPASSIRSRVHSLPVCDYILANISQKLSYGRNTRMRSLAHMYFPGFCNLSPLSQFSLISKISFSLLSSHVEASTFYFQFAHISWWCPWEVIYFSIGDEGIFLSFPNHMTFPTTPRKLHLTNSHASEWGKESIQAMWGNRCTKYILYSKKMLQWAITSNIFFQLL